MSQRGHRLSPRFAHLRLPPTSWWPLQNSSTKRDRKAEPPVTDTTSGFAWPDTPIGVIKTKSGYEFFASDGGAHYRQLWQGHWVGNNKSGSVVTTEATLDNPLGSGDPQDVSISSNPDSALSGWGMIRRCWERLSMSTSRTCLRTVQGGQRLAALRELMPNLMA